MMRRNIATPEEALECVRSGGLDCEHTGPELYGAVGYLRGVGMAHEDLEVIYRGDWYYDIIDVESDSLMVTVHNDELYEWVAHFYE